LHQTLDLYWNLSPICKKRHYTQWEGFQLLGLQLVDIVDS